MADAELRTTGYGGQASAGSRGELDLADTARIAVGIIAATARRQRLAADRTAPEATESLAPGTLLRVRKLTGQTVTGMSAALDACLEQGYEVAAAADGWMILRAAHPAPGASGCDSLVLISPAATGSDPAALAAGVPVPPGSEAAPESARWAAGLPVLAVPDVSAVLDACLEQGYEVAAAADGWMILRAAHPATGTGGCGSLVLTSNPATGSDPAPVRADPGGQECERLRRAATRLHQQIAARVLIGQATGILAARRGCSVAEAYTELAARARRSRTSSGRRLVW